MYPENIGRHILQLTLLLVLLLSGCPQGPSTKEELLLGKLWTSYKQLYITPDGRVLDRRQNRVTSEGQSYALLRAAWMEDRATFETVLAWTEENLRRPDDLYAWLWQPLEGGKVVDWNTATDADQDIAFALILASVAFDQPQYLDHARQIIVAVREKCSLSLPDGWFISAGNWANKDRITNLSYFSPLAYEYFHQLDPEGGWQEVIKTGYKLIAETLSQKDIKLIPDFIRLNTEGRVELLPFEYPLSTVFSYDSMRIFWRIGMDCRLHGRPEACNDFSAPENVIELMEAEGALYGAYTPKGEALINKHESPCFYACLLPAIEKSHPHLLRSILDNQLAQDEIVKISEEENRYYDLNWIWFGLAGRSSYIQQHTPPLTHRMILESSLPGG